VTADILFQTDSIDRELYLSGLNTCFGQWGDAERFEWCFERDAGAGRAGLMLARLNGEVIGGSAVVYRAVRSARGVDGVVGIMCGSWTLPAARGQGCFSAIIQQSVRMVAARGAAMLLAFVTETNPSKRRLEAAGATMVPSGYCVAELDEDSPASSGHTHEQVALSEREPVEGVAQFLYPASGAFAAQFTGRIEHTEVRALSGGGQAVIELTSDTERVLGLLGVPDELAALEELRLSAASRSMKSFFYTMDDDILEAAPSRGFRVIPGFLTVMTADADACTAWLGEPPEGDHPALAQLGRWSMSHGDRM